MIVKETYGIKAKFDGDEAKHGIKQINEGLSGIGSTAKTAIAAFAGFKGVELIINGITGSIGKLKDVTLGAIETAGRYQDQTFQMDAVFRNLGTTYDEQRDKIKSLSEEMWNYAGVGESTVNEIVKQMAIFSGDIEEAYRAVPAILDLTSTGLVNIDMATRGLSQTYEGQVGVLGRYLPALRNLSEEELKQGKAIDFILGKYKGLAHAHTVTLPGSIETLKDSFQDLAISLAGKTSKSFASMISEVAEEIHTFSKSSKAKEMANVIGQIATNIERAVEALLGGNVNADGFSDLMMEILNSLEHYTGTQLTGDLRQMATTMNEMAQAAVTISTALKPLAMAVGGWKQLLNLQSNLYLEDMRTAEFYANKGKGKASGGMIYNGEYGSYGNDNIKVPVKAGEFIVNANAASRYSGFLDYINSAYPSGLGGSGFASGGSFEEWQMFHEYAGGSFGGRELKPGEMEKFRKQIRQKYGYQPGGITAQAASFDYAMNILKGGNLASMYMIGNQQAERVFQYPQMGFPSSDIKEEQMWRDIAQFAKRHMTSDDARAAVGGFISGAGEALKNLPRKSGKKEKPGYKEQKPVLSTIFGEKLTSDDLISLAAYYLASSSDSGGGMTPTAESKKEKITRLMGGKSENKDFGLIDYFRAMMLLDPGSLDIAPAKAGYMKNETNMFDFFGFNPPAFAAGGTIPGRKGQPQMIMAHGGEEVITPESKELMRRFIATASQMVAVTGKTQHNKTRIGALGGNTIIIAADDNSKAKIIADWLRTGAGVDVEQMAAYQRQGRGL